MHRIYHYSTFLGGNASEYIVPNGNIDITSHGMGSGIYGLSYEYTRLNPASNTFLSNEYIFTIYNPFVLKTDTECEMYMEGSKTLMRIIEENVREDIDIDIEKVISKIDLFMGDRTTSEYKEESDKNPHIDKHFDLEMTKNAIKAFLTDYRERKNYVEMPINYILKAHGYDGVVSKPMTICHTWGRGNVKFIDYPTEKVEDKYPVGFILCRSGISRPLHSLSEYDYVYNGSEWIKK